MKIAVIRDKLKRVKNKQGQKDQIVIVDSASDVIMEESEKWKFLEKECGGALIGTYKGNKCFILYAVRTGYFADQSAGGISTDFDYQNKVFDILLAKYSRANLMYLGDYHLHPMCLRTLSGTDERTCFEILSDPRHKNLPKLAIILTTYCNGQQEIYPYLVSRNNHNGYGQISIERKALDIVKSENSSVKKLLKKEYIEIDILTKETASPGIKREGITLLNSFYEMPFYKIPILRERFIEEVDKIKYHFQTDLIPVYNENGVVSLEFRANGMTIHIFFPREYPLNPPTIYFGFDKNELSEFSSKRNWNSMSSSIDLLEELLEERKIYDD